LAQNGFKGLEDAIVSMTTTGTFNFQQFALSIVEETIRMVTRLMVIAPLLQSLQNLLNPAKGLFGGIGNLNPTVGFGTGVTGFAKGGVVNKATMFTFADGGSGRFGLAGEAGPEAIMPLRRGRDGRLGVQATNGGGGVSVVVNVDAGGSNVQGNNNQAGQLGKAVGAAVQAELIKQRRPGGLLA
jgi:lambda family phage tail tape measure protein